MDKLIKKYNGGYHYINENVFKLLQQKAAIFENNELDILEEDSAGAEFNDYIKSLLKQNGYDIEKIKDKKVQNEKLTQIFNDLNNDYNVENIKSVINQFIENEKNQQTQATVQMTKQQEEPSTDNIQQTTSSETKVSDKKSETTNKKQTGKLNPTMTQYITDKNQAYIKLMKKFNMFDDIIALANEKEKSNYTEETIPSDILYKYASLYQPFRNKLLTTRFRNVLKNVNLPIEMKNEMVKLYKQDEKKPNSIRNILTAYAKKGNTTVSAFDFPIVDYYCDKYNKLLSNDVYSRLANLIHEYLNGDKKVNDEFKDKLDKIITDCGIKPKYQPTTIVKKLKEKYSTNITDYLMDYNKNIDSLKSINNLSDEELIDMFQGDRFLIYQNIQGLFDRIINLMKLMGLYRYIDYIFNQSKASLSELESGSVPQIGKIHLLTEYNSSSILTKIVNDPEIKESWKMSVPAKNISSIYDDFYNIVFSNQDETISFRISFINGFPWLEIFKKNFEKGKQIGRNWKGFFKSV